MLNIVLLDEGIDARKVLNGVGAEFILMEQRAELTVVLGTRNFTRCVCEFLFKKQSFLLSFHSIYFGSMTYQIFNSFDD